MVVEAGLRSRIGSLDQPFLILIIQTKKPCGIALATLANNIIQMPPVPAFPATILEFSRMLYLGKADPQKGLIRQRRDPRFARRLL